MADRRECLHLCVANSGTRNGNHPTAAGYRFLADEVAQALRGRVKAGQTVVCFGDSIRRPVAWKGGADVSQLAGRPVRLRLDIRKADVYYF